MDFDRVLGLKLDEKISEVKTEIPEHIQELLDARMKARNEKDWNGSDELRDKIHAFGFVVKDTDKGQEVTKL